MLCGLSLTEDGGEVVRLAQVGKENERKKNLNSVSKWLLLLIGILMLCGIFFLSGSLDGEEESKILSQIKSYQGYTRVVSKEEQEFYAYFVKRDLGMDVSEENMRDMVEDYINKVNAVFLLGNKLGLSEPYSFDLLKHRMEQENRNRQLKKEQGEVIYGIEQFTLQTFYQYEKENLESDIIAYLENHADKGIINKAEAFYKEHEELFIGREAVVYEVTEDGVTREVEADRNQLDFLGNADRGLADFLEMGKIEDVYEDMKGGTNRTVVIKEIWYTKRGFKHNRDYVLTYYIRNVLLEDVIEITAQNNPVELQ